MFKHARGMVVVWCVCVCVCHDLDRQTFVFSAIWETFMVCKVSRVSQKEAPERVLTRVLSHQTRMQTSSNKHIQTVSGGISCKSQQTDLPSAGPSVYGSVHQSSFGHLHALTQLTQL